MRTIKYKSDKKIEASQMEKKTEIKKERETWFEKKKKSYEGEKGDGGRDKEIDLYK